MIAAIVDVCVLTRRVHTLESTAYAGHMRIGMSATTAFNLGLTLVLAGIGFLVMVHSFGRHYLTGAAVVCFLLALISMFGAGVAHYRPSATSQPTGDRTAAIPTVQGFRPGAIDSVIDHIVEHHRTAAEMLRPKVAMAFAAVPPVARRCFHLHNHGDAGAMQIHALIKIPDTGFTTNIFISQLAAGATTFVEPTQLSTGDRPMAGQADIETILAFFSAARQTARKARALAEERRVRSAREAGDDETQADTNVILEGMFVSASVRAGSDEVVTFDLIYDNFERTRRYQTPHALTISATGEISIVRIGVEANPLGVPTSPPRAPNDVS